MIVKVDPHAIHKATGFEDILKVFKVLVNMLKSKSNHVPGMLIADSERIDVTCETVIKVNDDSRLDCIDFLLIIDEETGKKS